MLKYDNNSVARANAAAALGTVAEKSAPAIKDAAIPALIYALDRDDLGVRHSAAASLVKFGPVAREAIPVLRKNLVPSDTSVAWFSAEALGAMGEFAREAVPDLVKVVEGNQETYVNDSAHICDYATTALGKIGPVAHDAVPSLVALLHHKNPYFRARLAVAIIRIDPNNREPLRVLADLLKDQDVQVRRVTMWSLGDSGKAASPAKGLIEAALADPDESVRAAAARLLETLNSH
jgi:HEAT repeat protein